MQADDLLSQFLTSKHSNCHQDTLLTCNVCIVSRIHHQSQSFFLGQQQQLCKTIKLHNQILANKAWISVRGMYIIVYCNQKQRMMQNKNPDPNHWYLEPDIFSLMSSPSRTGVSAKQDYDMNSLAVPRKAQEAIGGIACLTHRDKRKMTVNVEYNQLEPLLRATTHPDGDTNDESGFSPFPGKSNSLYYSILYLSKLGPSQQWCLTCSSSWLYSVYLLRIFFKQHWIAVRIIIIIMHYYCTNNYGCIHIPLSLSSPQQGTSLVT